MLTHFSLCSGIGGLDLAAEWAGFETVGQCEIEPYASKVLAKNFPGVHNFGDIRTITAAAVRAKGITDITVLSAGIPCQPYSLAGKGLGDGDERDLEQELIRVVGEFNPKWVIVENTPGLFARKNQRYFDRIIKDLSALGRTVAWGMWGACDVGAWHKRDRVFIVGHSNSFNGKAKSEVQKRQSPEPCRNSGNDDSHSISKRLERGHGQPIPTFGLCETVSDANSKSNARLSGGEAQKISELRGDPARDYWAIEPDVGRVADGIATRMDVYMRGGVEIENLSILRCCSCSESMAKRQRHEGNDIFVSQILQYKMLQQCNTCKKRLFKEICKKEGAEALSDNPSIEVRNLRSFWGKAEPSSQGWQYFQQCEGEHSHMLLEMPQQSGYDIEKMGQKCSRISRLRCLGNAVVPQQFYPVFKAIADYERTMSGE